MEMCRCCVEARIYFVVTGFLSVILILQVYWLNYTTEVIVKLPPIINQTKPFKYILSWTAADKSASSIFSFQEGTDPFQNCKIKTCFATSNKSLLPVEEYDAILFYAPVFTKKDGIPLTRTRSQKYVFVNMEPPVPQDRQRLHFAAKNFYNWTMTYRLDSDIYKSNWYVVQKKTKYKMPDMNFIKSRKKSVAWLASNCDRNDTRNKFVKKLNKYIPVDVYGSCGNMTCPASGDCYRMLEKNYKFLLSLERFYCRDYTSDALLSAMEKNLVPIVYGGGNYVKVAPPHSYINTESFKNPERLANYLKYLEQDVDSYLLFFQWKKSYKIDKTVDSAACKLCKMLHDKKEATKTYDNVDEWWFGGNNSLCRRRDHIPKILL